MKFRLKKLTVKNFKVFSNFEVDFQSESLSLLDGPNGFGKTSFFDALELLFLGKVQRYIDIDNKTKYGKKKAKPYPLMFDRSDDDACVSVQLLVELEQGKYLTLKRSASCASLRSLQSLQDAVFKLDVFQGDKKVDFSDESEILDRLLGENYKSNYSLLNYIEQEENTALLKNKDIDKQGKIDHLFDVEEYRERINKITRVRDTIRPLRTDGKGKELERLHNEITALQKEVSLEKTISVEYSRLIHSSNQPWDQESILFDAGSYAHWLGDNGELAKLQRLKIAESDFLNNKFNSEIKQKLALEDKALEPLLRFGGFIREIPKFKRELELYENSKAYLSFVDAGTVKLIKDNLYLPFNAMVSRLEGRLDFQLMQKNAETIINDTKATDVLTQSLNDLVASRDAYIFEFNKYQSLHDDEGKECPTCGFDWKSYDELVRRFDGQRQSLIALLDGQGTILQKRLESFKVDFIDVIKHECELIIAEQEASIEYKRSLCGLSDKQISFLNGLIKKYGEYNIDLTNLFVSTLSMGEALKTQALKDKVSSYFRPVNYDLLKPEFDDLFKAIFDESTDELNRLSINDIKSKSEYIKQKYSESRVKEIELKLTKYEEEKNRFDKANKLEKELKRLTDIYNDNVNSYISSISKGIEILFHIYSGRLLQNFHNGLGVFIETDGKSVSFKDTPQSQHDVIFVMSSGQLSSLVIAFTLALNKKYAKNDLLLIDDPVQTMDEINVAGFIDLLRHQFKDRHIFISTHEDHTSSYFRYKFQKAGLTSERINFNKLNNNI